MKQFIEPSIQLPKLDIIAVDGDIFDRKVMSNSDVAMYATKFISNLVWLAEQKNATLVLLSGTYSHDYDQLKLFYHYLDSSRVDVRIITSIQFEMIKGARVLCIPELYGLDESVYRKFFFESGYYDAAFVHGTFEGSVYGNNVSQGRLLTPRDFIMCKGFAISGHVHKRGCFSGFYYYCGCPYRWKFNEEEDKGYLLLAHDLDTQLHYIQFVPIKSDTYITIYLDELISEDPQMIINYIDNEKNTKGIDYIKVRIRYPISGSNKNIINQYYRNSDNTFVEFLDKEEIKKEKLKQETTDSYNYLLDDSISDLERFCRYVNDNQNELFITVDKLKKVLSDSII
jgi:DNA repair exonuclease SbcCD nuclease subunit